MFSLVAGVYDSYLAPSQLNILVVGAPGSGKTSFLERLKVTDIPKKSRAGSQKDRALPVLPLSVGLALESGGAHREAYEDARRTSITRSRSTNKAIAADDGASTALPEPNSNPNSNGHEAIRSNSTTSHDDRVQPNKITKRRSLFPLICPAPERYRNAALSDEDADDDSIVDLASNDSRSLSLSTDTNDALNLGQDQNTQDPLRGSSAPTDLMREQDRSARDSDGLRQTLMNGNDYRNPGKISNGLNGVSPEDEDEDDEDDKQPTQNATKPKLPQHASLLQDSTQEYDLRPKRKMLPLDRVRPTIGTNLAKLELFGANCHFFDVGGRLQSLWERYYKDCDAVIFCWKLLDPVHGEPEGNSEDSDSDSDDTKTFDMTQQLDLLEKVRASIPDDVPFLVVGHIFGPAKSTVVDCTYTTSMLLPHYHNPTAMALCCASAQTGAGVKHAMAWLVPLARRLQRERLRQQQKKELIAETKRGLIEQTSAEK